MNMDDLLDKMEENPIKFMLTFWLLGGLLSLLGLVIAIVVIVLVLTGFGVI